MSNYGLSMFIIFTQEPPVTFHQLRNAYLCSRAGLLEYRSAVTVKFTAKLSSDVLRETATANRSSLN